MGWRLFIGWATEFLLIINTRSTQSCRSRRQNKSSIHLQNRCVLRGRIYPSWKLSPSSISRWMKVLRRCCIASPSSTFPSGLTPTESVLKTHRGLLSDLGKTSSPFFWASPLPTFITSRRRRGHTVSKLHIVVEWKICLATLVNIGISIFAPLSYLICAPRPTQVRLVTWITLSWTPK